MGKVLLIGGSPMIGKSTVARKISAMYEWSHLFTDEQCRLHNRKQLKIYGNETVDEIVKGIIEKVGL